MMQPSEQNRNPNKKALVAVSVYASILLALAFLIHLESLLGFFEGVFGLLRPIVWGLILSYLVNPFFRFFERRAFSRLRHLGFRRFLSLILSYLSIVLIISILIAILIPQLIAALTNFFTNLGGYVDAAIDSYNAIVTNLIAKLESAGIHQNLIKPTNLTSEDFSIGKLIEKSGEIMKWVEPFLAANGSFSILGLLSDVFSVITDLIFALGFAVAEARHTQIVLNVGGGDSNGCRLALDDLGQHRDR